MQVLDGSMAALAAYIENNALWDDSSSRRSSNEKVDEEELQGQCAPLLAAVKKAGIGHADTGGKRGNKRSQRSLFLT